MKSDYLPIILIIIVVALVGGIIYYYATMNTEFNEGEVYFQIPGTWSQSQIVGNFNNTAYSAVTFTKEITDANGNKYPAYINVQSRLVNGTSFNITSLQLNVLSASNSTVSNLKINSYNILILSRNSPQVSNKIAVIDQGDYELLVEYICPPAAKAETEEAYNKVLSTLNIDNSA
ncbi:hypothetical protein [Methanobacterium alcaliphilum]|uniref:hypothetical protein n=1 Tax=Methanobacterium alcaliphilum TaxID=392018 RepID=UPI002009DDCF|nr:hypothetical protein [Methanobacterium alcaliphilum]MCK9150459.1 hypothetical protein [Methanobacterium alcaliphilum]